MEKKARLKTFAFPVVAIALLLGATACGRDYHVTGKVVIVPRESARAGTIIEVTGKAMPQEGTPLAGASVRITLYLDKRGGPEDPSSGPSARTDSHGNFDLYDYGAPGRKRRVGLEATHPDYGRIYTTYVDDVDVEPQTFFIAFGSLP